MLKDIAKILVGATATEMGWNIWLIAENMTPVRFLGLEFGFISIMLAIMVNFIFFVLAIYYAWFWKKTKAVKKEEIK